jgi:hypothetical protein
VDSAAAIPHPADSHTSQRMTIGIHIIDLLADYNREMADENALTHPSETIIANRPINISTDAVDALSAFCLSQRPFLFQTDHFSRDLSSENFCGHPDRFQM